MHGVQETKNVNTENEVESVAVIVVNPKKWKDNRRQEHAKKIHRQEIEIGDVIVTVTEIEDQRDGKFSLQ